MIRRRALLPGLMLLAAFAAVTPALADDNATIKAVASNIDQVVSAGSWSNGGRSGFYRAIVLVSGPDAGHVSAKVYLQWLAITNKPVPSVVTTVPIARVNAMSLPNAAVDLFAGQNGPGSVTLVASTVDPRTKQETDFYGTATSPGHFSMAGGDNSKD